MTEIKAMESLKTKLQDLGLDAIQAHRLAEQIEWSVKKNPPDLAWQLLVKEVLSSIHYSFPIYELLYQTIYPDWDITPAPAWFPEPDVADNTHIAKFIREKKFENYADLHRWSVNNFEDFWQTMLSLLKIKFDKPFQKIVDLSKGIESPLWFPDAKMNIANSCFNGNEFAMAIISQTEQGKVRNITYGELDRLSNRIANSLGKHLKKGERAAIIMPMTDYAVAIYLGIIKAGCAVVAIPDSFAIEEISIRLKIADVRVVFCQDQIIRDGKSLPLYEKMLAAKAPLTIVLPAAKSLSMSLRPQDLNWENFLVSNDVFTPVSCKPHDHINILFSSGTTGAPKAIPWTHTTALKCGSDAYWHHDLQEKNIFCWPTNLGWMMGPWLIFACLLNKATIAIYDGTPNGQPFGKFIENAKVTHLGVVPTMVKTWRHSACMEGLDWSKIKLFTSTGERSNVQDMLYLMLLAHYRPIIEYCGGTEIGGAYITSTLVQPLAPAAFTTPTLGLDFMMIDEQGLPTDNGEVAIIPPSIGLSTELLNNDHHKIYFDGMPRINNKPLRRHGDHIKKYANGFYRLLGRVDDTMKLGGIKVSSAEIENAVNKLPYIDESAAIAVNPSDSGPSLLVVYVVLNPQQNMDVAQIKLAMQKSIKQNLNPLFKLHDVIVIDALPRTASNKVMRRVLREKYQQKTINKH